ncbi:MAG: hypothetical protein LBD95_03285 [Clostridiales Family XIII bacterium]|nr:hypothetical protein [Clostridiales Family XIII bacterium]
MAKLKNGAIAATMLGHVEQSHMNKHFHKYLNVSIHKSQENPLLRNLYDGLNRNHCF